MLRFCISHKYFFGICALFKLCRFIYSSYLSKTSRIMKSVWLPHEIYGCNTIGYQVLSTFTIYLNKLLTKKWGLITFLYTIIILNLLRYILISILYKIQSVNFKSHYIMMISHKKMMIDITKLQRIHQVIKRNAISSTCIKLCGHISIE